MGDWFASRFTTITGLDTAHFMGVMMKSAGFVKFAVVVLAPALVLAGAASRPAATRPAGPPERIRYGRPKKLCDLANQRIDESSGLACSRLRSGVFWTHNDSGDRPRIYAFDAAGRDLGFFTVRGARAVDWEDMASFKLGRRAYLLLADVGDNASARRSCQLYIVPEPMLDKAGRPRHGTVKVAVKIAFTYDDGPHNCESVAVDPVDRKIYLATKEFPGQAKVYELPLPARSPGESLKAKAIASIDVPMATAMDISPDGRRAVILSYGPAYEYVRREGESWAAAFSRKPRRLAMPPRVQGESICYGPAGRRLYLTSEGLPTPLWLVPVAAEK